MAVIGELNADGTIKAEPDTCAITGRALGGHMTMQRIKDTPYFYRYLSDFQFKLTDEKRAEIEALVPKETVKNKASKPLDSEKQ